MPQGLSQGRSLLVEIVREAIPEPGRTKLLYTEIIANPAAFTSFIGGVAEHVTVDSTLSDQIIRDLALSLRLTANDITLLQAPISGFGTSPDGQSIDVVDEAQLAALGKAMKSDAMAAYVEKYGDQ